MLTKSELEFYEHSIIALQKLVKEVTKIREAVEMCTGRPVPSVDEAPLKDEHPINSLSVGLVVTNVKVFPFKEGIDLGHIKGVASVVINDQLQLRGLRIMDGENGFYVGYPNDPFYKGDDLRSMYFPITRQLREHIENCVLEMYNEVTK